MTRLILIGCCVAFLAAGSPSRVWGQVVGSEQERLQRLSELTGATPVTPLGARGSFRPPAESTISLTPATFRVHGNSGRAWGVNDGATWQGRGLTMSVSGGMRARLGPVEVQLEPLLWRAENRAFELSQLPPPPGLSPFAYPTLSEYKIDAPQRFGANPLSEFDWGQSAIRVRAGAFSAGFSHENLWWGPGLRNSITMSNNAPGFWHAFVGTPHPADIGMGTMQARWIWGSLRESAWFDSIPGNDRRFVTGAVVTVIPRWTPQLELGGARVVQQQWREGGPSAGDLFLVAKPSESAGSDERDQITSLFARLVLAESGFEFYGEWGKGDRNDGLRDLLVQPEYGSGWLFGAQKAFRSSEAVRWTFSSEVTLLGAPRSTEIRSEGAGFFYVHRGVPQGYTNRGQVMGAGIGTGSSQVMLRTDRYARWGRAGVGLLRTVYDNDRFYRRAAPQDRRQHEVEPTLLADLHLIRGRWDLSASLALSRLMNFYYRAEEDWMNTNLSLGATYHPGARR